MWRTLFYIPERIDAVPILGFGLLFWLWVAWTVFTLGRMAWRQGLSRDFWNSLGVHAFIAAIIALVLPRLCVVVPGVFTAGGDPVRGLPVRGYGTMLLLAVLAAVGLAVVRANKRGFSIDWVTSLALWCIIPGIIGARLFHVIEYWPVHYGKIWRIQGPAAGLIAVLNVAQGGLVVYGSLLGGLAGIIAYAKKQRVNLFEVFDILAPCFLLGLAFGRLGCFLNGCCFGGVCDLPWAVQFPAGSFAYLKQLEEGQLFFFGLKFREDPNHPQRLPVILEVEPRSPAARAGVQPGEHIAVINGYRLTPAEGESPALQAVTQLVALMGDPVLIEGGRGCVCACDIRDQAESTRTTTVTASNGGKAGTVLINLETAHGRTYLWEAPRDWPQKSLPVHPTQLYSAFNAMLLCLFLLAYEPFVKTTGELWAWFLTLYPPTRFLLEVIRADEPGAYWGMTIAQVVSVILFGIGVATWVYLRLVRRRLPEPSPTE